MSKQLPDFSDRDWKNQCYFSAENTQPIAEKFGFPPDYQLATKLNEAACESDMWEKRNLMRLPRGAEGRVFFKEMEKRAFDLIECFDKLGGGTVDFLKEAKACGLGFDFDPCAFRWKLHCVAMAAKTAAKRVLDKDSGRDPDIALPDFIARLRSIYCEGTGKDDRVTYNAYTGTYNGPFLGFVKFCLAVKGINKKDGALVKVIYQVLDRMERIAPKID